MTNFYYYCIKDWWNLPLHKVSSNSDSVYLLLVLQTNVIESLIKLNNICD